VKTFSLKFYYFGEIKSISIKLSQNCAFIEFTSRDAAEAAAEQLNNNLEIKGIQLKLSWAKSHKDENNTNYTGSIGPGREGFLYPSMDPKRLGSYVPVGPKKPLSLTNENNTGDETEHYQTSITNNLSYTVPSVNTAPEVDDDEENDEENNEKE